MEEVVIARRVKPDEAIQQLIPGLLRFARNDEPALYTLRLDFASTLAAGVNSLSYYEWYL